MSTVSINNLKAESKLYEADLYPISSEQTVNKVLEFKGINQGTWFFVEYLPSSSDNKIISEKLRCNLNLPYLMPCLEATGLAPDLQTYFDEENKNKVFNAQSLSFLGTRNEYEQSVTTSLSENRIIPELVRTILGYISLIFNTPIQSDTPKGNPLKRKINSSEEEI